MANNSTDKFKATIKAYLDKYAAQDELFKGNYSKPNKSIEECCGYIIQEVQKAGICGWSNGEIFGMAIKYYTDDTIKVAGNTPNVKIVNTNGHDDTPLTTAPTPQAPSAPKGKGKGKGKSNTPAKPTPAPASQPVTATPPTAAPQPSAPTEGEGNPNQGGYTASLF